MPLVAGQYPPHAPLPKFTGQLMNVNQGNIPARSNLEWFGLGAVLNSATTTTGVNIAVACPVEVGDVITSVTWLTGATAAVTPTAQFSALYAGTGAAPALIGQSTDSTTGAWAASTAKTHTLTSPLRITQALAPTGFIYVNLALTAGTMPTLCSVACATAANYQWFATGPLGLSMTHGTAQGGTAAATIASPTAFATAPICFLR